MTSSEPPKPVPVGETRITLDSPEVQVTDQHSGHQLDLDRYRNLALNVLVGEGVPAGAELTVVFVSTEDMTELNAKHMGRQEPTDVLAFPIDAHDVNHPNGDPIPVLLGDVVICPTVAAANSSTNSHSYPGHAGSLRDEIDLLVVHGILHVLGMDHADDEERNLMQASERTHLAAFRERDQ